MTTAKMSLKAAQVLIATRQDGLSPVTAAQLSAFEMAHYSLTEEGRVRVPVDRDH